MSALLTFLGGSVFRMLWGELSSYLNKRQDHKHEIELLGLQRQADAEAHARNMQSMELQRRLGIEEVRVAGEAAVSRAEADAFIEAQKNFSKPTGIKFVDIWNGIIRPQFAQLALLLWLAKVWGNGFVMDEWDKELVAGILGFFVADRSLGKRGK